MERTLARPQKGDNMKRKLFLALALAFTLTGCTSGVDAPLASAAPPLPSETPGPAYSWLSAESPIPSQRTGLSRQGIKSNDFECTDTGVYFMCSTGFGAYLFYGDHGSDTLIKLCGRPDCDHNNEDCNAYFSGGQGLCYYNGYLYTMKLYFGSISLIRMNLDGTGRVNTMEGQSFQSSSAPWLWNGVFTTAASYLDENGHRQSNGYFYKLDGSMEKAEICTPMLPRQNDGTHFIGLGAVPPVEDPYGYGVAHSCWDPDTGEVQYLSDMMGLGYYGMEDAYYIRDGVIYHLNYAQGQEEILLETGLDDIEYESLACFPDCFVVNVQDSGADSTLYFYNWDCELLGQMLIEFPHAPEECYFICGETAERIILTDNIYNMPHYYIEKSDFGTGNIELHEYNIPDVNWEEYLPQSSLNGDA